MIVLYTVTGGDPANLPKAPAVQADFLPSSHGSNSSSHLPTDMGRLASLGRKFISHLLMAIYQGQITSSLSFLCCQITVQWSYTGFRVLILFLLAPASSSTRTLSRCPPAAAIHKGDIPSSFALSFAAPHASSQRTISN